MRSDHVTLLLLPRDVGAVTARSARLQSAASRASSNSGILEPKREKNDAMPLLRQPHNHTDEPPHLPLGDRMFHCRACEQTGNERTWTLPNHLPRAH